MMTPQRRDNSRIGGAGTLANPVAAPARCVVPADAAGDVLNNGAHRDDGVFLLTPHPLCLRAQHHHDVFLLEHGLHNHESSLNER